MIASESASKLEESHVRCYQAPHRRRVDAISCDFIPSTSVTDEISSSHPGVTSSDSTLRRDQHIGRICSKLKQVKVGEKCSSPNKFSCDLILFTDGWPSVGLAFRDIVDGSLFIGSSSEHLFKSSSLPGSDRFSWMSVDAAFGRISPPFRDILLVVGSFDFVSGILGRLDSSLVGSRTVVVFPMRRLRHASVFKSWNFKFTRIRHNNVGGLTARGYSIGFAGSSSSWSSSDVEKLSISYGLCRSPADAIKHAIDGTVCEACSHSSTLLQEPVRLISDVLKPIVVRSVFSRTNWVRRLLSPVELAAFADVPELDVPSFDAPALTVVMHSVPGKLADVISRFVSKILGPVSSSSSPSLSSLSVPQPAPTVGMSVGVDQGGVAPSDDSSMLGMAVGETQGLLFQPPANLSSVDVASDYLKSYGDKAAKDDDARVPVELWNSFLFRHHRPHETYSPDVHGKALDVIRHKFALRVYRRRTTRSLCRYLRTTYGEDWRLLRARSAVGDVTGGESALEKDIKIGLEGLRRIIYGSWWEWDNGSTLYFWRWPAMIRNQVRDGVKVFIEGKLPSYRKRQLVTSDPAKLLQVGKKVEKVVKRGYLQEGHIKSLINFFDVPKGEADIRLVYDGTKSGLNDAVWAPNFFLCSVDSALMWTNADTWYADRDLGEMFLNYFLDEALRAFSGVDVSQITEEVQQLWLAWVRTFMGFKPSPYIAAKLFGWTIDMIYGDKTDPLNPFKWDDVCINLPGQIDYDPTQPRICKMDGNLLASLLEAYVDDIRALGASEARCQRASSRIAQITQYLGQQDAPRKCRPPHQIPGPWCGAFMASKDDCVWVYVSQEKWNKAKTFVNELHDILGLSGDSHDSWKFDPELSPVEAVTIDYSFLEKGRGFLVYFSRTYPSLVPYLKGIHLTLDSWRLGRTADGWKCKNQLQLDLENLSEEALDDLKWTPQGSRENIPSEVSPVPRLKNDVLALKSFLKSETPPWRFVRGGKACIVQYGFADASKSGFGATFETDSDTTWYRLGVWGDDEREESSNYRELNNLVETLESRVADNGLSGLEIFLFTDNSTAERAFYKGSSTSKKLFELVLRLRQLELHQGCIIHFIHVSGTRMIAQGTDGLSRGDAQEGVMRGEAIHSFIPLHLSCLDRQPKLRSWLESFISPSSSQSSIEFLSIPDWFDRGHDILGGQKNGDGVWTPNYSPGTFIWTPPPAAGLVAIEQLRRARVKRELSTHVFVLPRLMSAEWMKQVYKVSDLCIELPFDDTLWKKDTHHEPLFIAFVFPFLPHRPWQLKRSPAFLGMAGTMRRMWNEGGLSPRVVLSQFFASARKLETLPQSMVRKMLRSPQSFGLSC